MNHPTNYKTSAWYHVAIATLYLVAVWYHFKAASNHVRDKN